MFTIDFREMGESRDVIIAPEIAAVARPGFSGKNFSPNGSPDRKSSRSSAENVLVEITERTARRPFSDSHGPAAVDRRLSFRSRCRGIPADGSHSRHYGTLLSIATSLTSRPVTREIGPLRDGCSVRDYYYVSGDRFLCRFAGGKGTCQRGPFYPERISRAD